MKQRSNTLFSLLLLFLFAFCSFFLVLVQVQGYQGVLTTNEEVTKHHTPVSYMRNKIRGFDQVGGVQVVNKANATYLKLANGESVVWIYEYEGYLYELYALEGVDINESEGDALFALDTFEVQLVGGTLQCSVGIERQKDRFSMNLRSGGTR